MNISLGALTLAVFSLCVKGEYHWISDVTYAAPIWNNGEPLWINEYPVATNDIVVCPIPHFKVTLMEKMESRPMEISIISKWINILKCFSVKNKYNKRFFKNPSHLQCEDSSAQGQRIEFFFWNSEMWITKAIRALLFLNISSTLRLLKATACLFLNWVVFLCKRLYVDNVWKLICASARIEGEPNVQIWLLAFKPKMCSTVISTPPPSKLNII